MEANTVLRTFAHGAGAWVQTTDLSGRVDTMERKMLKLTLKQACREGESPADFHKRLNSKVTLLIKAFGHEPLSVSVKVLNMGWLGHVGRRVDGL
jgi:hypothetical protein